MKKRISTLLAAVLISSATLMAQSTLKPKEVESIRVVLSRWNQFQDDGNLNGFMNLWAANPTFENPFGQFNSFEEIKGFEQNYLSGFANGKRHLASNTTITSDPQDKSKAVAIVDLMVVEVKEIPYIAATVRANVSLVKEDGLWKVKSVALAIDEGFNKLMEAAKK
ncbi:MAG TPA: hypothetical protein DDX92_13625 [Flavobacteriales bacterium]|jgi:hypothetical protein|nr:hypothetical protein [Flavobacteriales bacterium]